MTTLRPMFDYVIIERDEADELKNSSIILLESTKEELQPATGKVIAAGVIAGAYDNAGDKIESIEAGSHVIFARFAGTEIKHEDKAYWLIKDTDVLVTIKGA